MQEVQDGTTRLLTVVCQDVRKGRMLKQNVEWLTAQLRDTAYMSFSSCSFPLDKYLVIHVILFRVPQLSKGSGICYFVESRRHRQHRLEVWPKCRVSIKSTATSHHESKLI